MHRGPDLEPGRLYGKAQPRPRVAEQVVALVVTVGIAAAFGLGWRWRQGRVRKVAAAPPLSPALLAALGVTLGEQATLLQFSTVFCQPCRATRRVLERTSEMVPGVVHVDVDAESHLDAVRALHISSTPTTLILDASGREMHRATGTPRTAQVLAALGVSAAMDVPAP